MENPTFIDDENIPLINSHEDEDAPYTPMQSEGGTTEETSFSTPSRETPGSKIIPLSNELKRQKIYALHQELGVTGNVNLAELDRFRLNRNEKTGNTELKFFNGQDWVLLTNKRTGEFLVKTSIERLMGGVNVMKNMLGLDETPSRLERSKTTARKLASIIPTDLQMDNISMEDLSRTITTVEHEVKEASQNTDLNMREMLGLDKVQVQRVQGELANNLGKLTSIKEHIEREEQKLRDVKNDPSYTDEQRKEVQARLERLKEEHSARLELVSQNKNELQGQYARIGQTIEKVLDSNTSLKERIKTLFREQGITIIAVLTATGMTISTIILIIKNALGIGGGSGSGKPPSSDPNTLKVKNKLKALARLLGKLAGTALATLPSIIGSIVSWVLNMLKKVVGFAAEYTYAFITLLCGILGYWIVEQFSKKKR